MKVLLVVVSIMALACVNTARAQSNLSSPWQFEPIKPRAKMKRSRARRIHKRPPSVAPADQNGSKVDLAGGEAGSSQWRILRVAWTQHDEKGYEEFVKRIGESGCRTMHSCLTGAKSNPLYRASNLRGMYFYADCADLPYMLRAYYAWKNNLPFSYSSSVSPLGRSRDIRYTRRGNKIRSRRDLVQSGLDARRALQQIIDTITSAHYRYPPTISGGLLPDHYPVSISRESVKPGTIIYDPNGHVAVVYKVTPEGRVHYIDTHPDNSLTRGIYGKAFTRASHGMGAGFKRWRPQVLEGAVQDKDGHYRGGRIVLAADSEIADWSDEQFFGTGVDRPKRWRRAKFVFDGERLNYYDFVRKRLAIAGFRYNPVEETRTRVGALCEDLKYRVDAVNIAVKSRINRRPQPGRLPLNIYGTHGDWETYSTPSRDARLKTSFKELRDEVARFLALVEEDKGKLAYDGDDLRSDLREAYRDAAAACVVSYTKSDGTQKQLTFEEIASRLFKLSFDPHHCVERRWGADDREELASCPDGRSKQAWYEAQQRLRNQADRTYDTRMGFSLGQLRRAVPGSGIDQPPDIDVLGLLDTPATAGDKRIIEARRSDLERK